MKEVIVLQHIGCEGLGRIAPALERAGVRTRVYGSGIGETAPRETGGASGLVVMGGPMGVYEDDVYPYLRDEIKLIEDALKNRKPVLGVCLGSQLLAKTLGARVFKGLKKEIGWHAVETTAEGKRDALFGAAPARFDALHWHGDVFDLPHSAVSLASSELTNVQAYRYGTNAYGILFHLEITEPMLREWTVTFAGELRGERIDPASILGPAPGRLAALHAAGDPVFDRWAALLPPG